MPHLSLLLLTVAALSACSPRHDSGPRRFAVYSLWLHGQGETDRPELERFQQCLLDGSNFSDFWAGGVTIDSAGSWVVESPSVPLALGDDPAPWLAPILKRHAVPPASSGVTPIYLVYGHMAGMPRPPCGRCESFTFDGQPAALAMVRTGLPCWPGQGNVRSLTQFTQHELSCAIELALGEDHCAADGQCEARGSCPDQCDTFTGLYCPGAPERSYTGCDGNPVRGWVVQKLSHKGEGTDECPICAPCDFAVEATP